jgi:Spy/CpxP family protein refolding chaperone
MNMKSRKLMLAILLSAMAVPVAVPVFAANANDNPPGPAGGPGTNWTNPRCAANAPGVRADRPHRRLTVEQRTKLKAMTPEQRQAFFQQQCAERMKQRLDRGNNPPGPRGGPGAN